MNIDKKLNDIIDKNPIYPEYKDISLNKKIKEFVVNYLSSIIGRMFFISESRNDINEIVIKNGFSDNDYEIVEDKDVVETDITNYDNIVYLSFTNRKRWIKQLSDTYYDKNIIDLYKVLDDAGYNCTQEYYERYEVKRDPYANINHVKHMMNDSVNKKLYVQKLIYLYLEIRDFYYAFKYMDLYINEKYEGFETVVILKKQIQDLLVSIKDDLASRCTESIAMFWIDSVQYEEAKEMKFLSLEMNNSLCFDNSYTITPFTLPTCYTLFCQKKCIDDKYFTYKNTKITEENSKVLSFLSQNGFLFLRHGVAMGLFENENCSYEALKQLQIGADDKVKRHKQIKKYKSHDFQEDICPVLFWKCLCDLELNDKIFSLIHIDVETHTPYVSGNYEGEYINSQYNPNILQIDAAREYVDEQLEFYSDIWGTSIKTIIMSDHGKRVTLKSGKICNDIYHTIFMVKGKDIVNRHFEGMFSYIDFYEFIKMLIRNETQNIDRLAREYVEIEDLDKYGSLVVPLVDDEDHLISKQYLLGYRGIRTNKETFIIRSDGKNYYYKESMLINLCGLVDESKYMHLRELVGKYDVDLDNDLFVNTRRMLRAIEYHDERVKCVQQEAKRLINELFSDIRPDEVIALRPGGETSYEILRQHKNIQNNVKYIVDNNYIDEDELAVEFIRENEITSRKIDRVFITSFTYHSSMYKALSGIEDIEVVDIYEYLKENGVILNEDYLADKISSSDLREIYNRDL